VIVIKICFYTVDFAFVFIVYATVALFISCTQLKDIIRIEKHIKLTESQFPYTVYVNVSLFSEIVDM